jgi:predicted dienelactone hydrolase
MRQIISKYKLHSLTLGMAAAFFISSPAQAAERIYLDYGPLEFSISVKALETFANEGKIDRELGFFLNRLNEKQQKQLRSFLRSRYKVNPLILYRVTHTVTGERLLKFVGKTIKSKGLNNGFYGIRGSLIQSSLSPEGLNLINFLKKFPTNIEIDLQQVLKLRKEVPALLRNTGDFIKEIEQKSAKQAAGEPKINYSKLPDLRKAGQFSVARQTIKLYDSSRDRELIVDLYLPQVPDNSPTPVVIVSNGLGGQRDRFINIANHLASHGFAVVIPDHPGSNDVRQKAFFNGLHKENFDSTEYIDRPLDITYVLNELEKPNLINFKGKLNLQRVGIFGYSLGGTTALALAGAELNFQQLKTDCDPDRINPINISILYQCRALELPKGKTNLQDNRIKAAFVFVPYSSSLFGKTGMSRVNIPIFWKAVDEDFVTPLTLEQIPAFNYLTTHTKYLSISEGLPHTRVTVGLIDKILNTNRSKYLNELNVIMETYMKGLTVPFFQVYVAQDRRYLPYLTASNAKAISAEYYDINLIQFIKRQ